MRKLFAGKINFKDLAEEDQKLLKAAKRVLERTYSPYSGSQVGAAVLTKEGKMIAGTNYEVAAFGSSICAERAALLRANAQGHGDECVAIAIVTRNKDSPTTEISASCGECRQMIFEAAQRSGVGRKFRIIMATTNFDKVVVSNIGQLLPLAFGPKNLEKGKMVLGLER